MPAPVPPPATPRRRRRRLDIVGILLAPVGVLVVFLSQLLHGATSTALMQGAASLIVFGGTLGAVLLTYSPGEIVAAVRAAIKAFEFPETDVDALGASLVAMAIRAHRRGVLTLENDLETINDPFLREGLMLTIDGTSSEVFRDLLAIERSARDAEEDAPARVFEAAAGYAPTMGILGAVLGLMHVMENLSAPGTLGAGIAVAFVATVYGVGVANLVLLPIAGRLRERAAVASRRREMISQGLDAIHERLNPRLVARKLRVFSSTLPKIDEIANRVPQRAPLPGRLA
jgi:chemotaxis protein MotA